MSRSEFEAIQQYFSRKVGDIDVELGIGDDAAIIRADGPLVVATDTMVEGIHFPEHTAAEDIGFRALAINLSDMAAMGARPRWFTLALTIPESDDEWLEAFARGLFELAEAQQAALIGGDLNRGPMSVTLQVIGDLGGGDALTRSGGHIGDDVYVTGSLGDAAAGLALIGENAAGDGAEHRALAGRFLRPTPRVAEGRALAPVANAAIDISDGLLADLGHICEASGCGAVIDVERLPLSAELLALFPPQTAQAYALSGGDDYELCFTAPAARAKSVETSLEQVGTSVRRIGELVAGSGVQCRRGGVAFIPAYAGHQHF
ncbi:MAG TPA: thiamine-phosphate kinase [Gammaproteobacteria bacterium]